VQLTTELRATGPEATIRSSWRLLFLFDILFVFPKNVFHRRDDPRFLIDPFPERGVGGYREPGYPPME
jgi:hypothetical protein